MALCPTLQMFRQNRFKPLRYALLLLSVALSLPACQRGENCGCKESEAHAAASRQRAAVLIPPRDAPIYPEDAEPVAAEPRSNDAETETDRRR